MNRPNRPWTRPGALIAAAFLALAVGASTAWLVGGSSDDNSAGDRQTAAHQRSRAGAITTAARPHRPTGTQTAPRRRDETRPRGGYRLLPRIEPARIVPDPAPVVSADVLQPIVNGWRAGDHRGITLVEAGLAGDDPSGTKGRFVVFRERERPFAQNVDVVDVRGAGALRITAAPTGRRAGHWAQRRGEIEFAGEEGVTGTLHLADDTVTLGSG